jgi:hypothetical protein
MGATGVEDAQRVPDARQPYHRIVTTRRSALLTALRLAYVVAGILFVAAVTVAVIGSVTTFTTTAGEFVIDAEIPEDSPLNTPISWLALATFAAAALGALLTVIARVRAGGRPGGTADTH